MPYWAGNGLCCVLRDVSTNVVQRSDVEITRLADVIHVFVERQLVERIVDRDSQTSNIARWTDAAAAS